MFRKIGQFEIKPEGDLVLVWSAPEFNLESAQEYAAAMETVIDQMPPVWGVLARFDAPPILGPEVEVSIGVAHAFFTDAESAREWLREQIDRRRRFRNP